MRWSSGKWNELQVSEAGYLHHSATFFILKVKQSDKSTKICGNCFSTIYQYDLYRELCAATNRKMTREDVIAKLNSETTENSMRHRMSSSEALVIYLVDDETEPENDEPDAQAVSVTKPRMVLGENAMLSTVAAAKLRT